MDVRTDSEVVIRFAASPVPPEPEDVSEYHSENNYSCGCRPVQAVPQISQPDQMENQKYVPFSGRDITVVDHHNKRCLVNGYHLPMAELVVPSLHDSKLPFDPSALIHYKVEAMMQETERKVSGKMKIYFEQNREKVRRLFEGVCDYRLSFRQLVHLGKLIKNNRSDIDDSTTFSVDKMAYEPFSYLKFFLNKGFTESDFLDFEHLMASNVDSLFYEYPDSDIRRESMPVKLGQTLRECLLPDLIRLVHGDNLLTKRQSMLPNKLGHLKLWAAGEYARSLEFVGVVPEVVGDYFAILYPFHDSPSDMSKVLSHGLYPHELEQFILAREGRLDADLLSFLIMSGSWILTIDQNVLQNPPWDVLRLHSEECKEYECLVHSWPSAVSPENIERYLKLGQFSKSVEDILREGCPLRVARLAEVFGKSSLSESEQKKFLSGIIPDLRRVENLVALISHKAVCRHSDQYQLPPGAVYQMDAGTRDMETYNEEFLHHKRVMDQLQKSRQVIAIKETGREGEYQLVVLDKAVTKDQLSDYVNFIIVKGNPVEVPEYLPKRTEVTVP